MVPNCDDHQRSYELDQDLAYRSVVGRCVSVASAQDIVLCGFVSKKTGEAIKNSLAVEPGNP